MSMTTTDLRSDTELLLAYGRDGDESAFDTLARRHVDMIFAVSLRRSGNRQMAEEATQNVLIALSQNARKLSSQDGNLAAWLHTSTKFEVAKLQRHESRLKAREKAYANDPMKTTTQEDEEAFHRLLPMLDTAIDNLRPPDREVIVRRYLQGQDFRNIGKALGISEAAAQKRTSRAFDLLNQFFKRKAGSTLTAAALAAGISQHCAEAAPAACLQFTPAAATGVTFLFTTATITTMSTIKITAIAAGVVAIGAAVALLNRGDNNPPETISTSQAKNQKADTPSKPPLNNTVPTSTSDTETAPQEERASSADEEMAKLQAMSPFPTKEEFARRLAVKYEELLKDLTAELGLSATQMASLKEVLDQRLVTFRATLERKSNDNPDEPLMSEDAMVAKAGRIIRGVGLREDIADILSEEQLAAFDAREAKIQQAQIEAHAYLELSKLSPVLDLTEEQKDRAFELLQTSSAQKLTETASLRAFMALKLGQTPSQVDVTDLTEMQFLMDAMGGPNALLAGTPEFNEKIVGVVRDKIRNETGVLAPVLTQQQMQRYEDHLFQLSLLPALGIELPKSEQKMNTQILSIPL